MTAQIGDSFNFKGNNYSIVAISKPIKFDPSDYGLKPVACCTACWNGYWCDYDISKDGIFLRNLYVNTEGEYPEINGIKAQGDSNNPRTLVFFGHHVYKDLNIPIDYTGKILVGDKFIHKYYIHMGYQRAWAYEILIELCFKKGKLVNEIDQSKKSEELREKFDRGEIKENSLISIKNFVKECFSLKYSDKVWWGK